MEQISQPLTLYLLGITGDLSKKKILHAVYKLFEKNLLPTSFQLIGNARSSMSRPEFEAFVETAIKPKGKHLWSQFIKTVTYISGDTTEPSTFAALASAREESGIEGNTMWYIATLPHLYLPIIRNIKHIGLHGTAHGWTKVMIEKPFGIDLASAQELNTELMDVFTEDQIYRIDHYLGKETVQNMVAFRFANGLFEELWNNKHIDHIQVTMAETLGVTGREQFYDAIGATRDVAQNHLLQMIAITMMEEPSSLKAEDIRHRRTELLTQLRCTTPDSLHESVRFGQFSSGTVDGHQVPGYKDHAKLSDSDTETAVALKLEVDNDRWRGVPIYVRAGKRLQRDVLELSIQFRDPHNAMFKPIHFGPDPNILTFRFQPNEGIVLRLFVKKPGHGIELDMVPMQFLYHNQYQMGQIEAYERLIHDATIDDPTLFPRVDSIEAAWSIIDPILKYKETVTPDEYPAGSWGPESFDNLIMRDGRNWIQPSIDVCPLP